MLRPTDKNFEEFDEFIHAVAIATREAMDASADGKISLGEVLGMLPKAPAIVKGITGVQEMIPVLQATHDEDRARVSEIIRSRFKLSESKKDIEIAIENFIFNGMGFYSSARALISLTRSAEA